MESEFPITYFDLTGSGEKLYARYLKPLCRQRELSRNEVDVLLFLLNNPGLDRAADVSSRRGIAKSYVSLAVASLERRGLLRRRFDETDRRNAHLSLTQEGTQIAMEGRECQQRFYRDICQGIPAEDLAVCRRVSRMLYENMKALNKR